MRFHFALSGYYPTTKAYGVTTKGTIDALKELGHEVSIVSRFEVTNLINGHGFSGKLTVKISDFFYASPTLSKFYFPIWQVIFSLVSIPHISKNKSVIWVREPKLAVIYSQLTRNNIVCEIHQVNGLFSKIYIWFLAKNSRVTLAPIKTKIAIQAKLHTSDTPIAFMAVNEEFLQSGRLRNVYRTIVPEIVIVANLSNKYQVHSAKRLLKQIDACLHFQNNMRFYFAGIKEYDARKLKLLTQENNRVKFLGHLSHERILTLLSRTDIGIIPYCDNDYFMNTFPIKAVEYAATKNVIIASDTRAHRDLLQKNALFYDLEDNLGLFKAISVACSEPEKVRILMDSAYNWAKEHSYQARVLAILNKISIST